MVRTKLLAFLTLFLVGCSATQLGQLRRHQINENLQLVEIDHETYVLEQIRIPYQANALFIRVGVKDWVLVDTPVREKDALDFLLWMQDQLEGHQLTVINTHFHEDSTGSNLVFIEKAIPVMASKLTNTLLKNDKREHLRTAYTFPLREAQVLKIGAELVEIHYPGPSHSQDNVIVYFPKKRIAFGSCLTKSGEDLGHLKDVNLKSWKRSLERLLAKNLALKFLIPGHGENFSPSNWKHTLRLLNKKLQTQ